MRPVRSEEARQARGRLTVSRVLTSDAARESRTISLGMSTRSSLICIAAGRLRLTLSVSDREIRTTAVGEDAIPGGSCIIGW